MVHAQKPAFVFRRNGQVHLNRRGPQFSRLLAAEVCVSAVVMLDTHFSEVVWRVLATHSIRQFPFTSPHVRYRVPSHFNWTLNNISLLLRNKFDETFVNANNELGTGALYLTLNLSCPCFLHKWTFYLLVCRTQNTYSKELQPC